MNTEHPLPRPETTTVTPTSKTNDRSEIRAAKFDPRFDTFWKRLAWFKHPDETFKEFALRCGVSPSTLRRWKAGGTPRLMETARALAQRLDVCNLWLSFGIGHYSSVFPSGTLRLTSIPRFDPHYLFTDQPGEDEPRPYTSFYH